MVNGHYVTATATGILVTPATNNDQPWKNADIVIIGTQSNAFTITGIAAPLSIAIIDIFVDGSGDGTLSRGPLTIINASGQTMTVTNQDVASSAANRISTGSGGAPANLSIANGGTVVLIYDFDNNYWRVLCHT